MLLAVLAPCLAEGLLPLLAAEPPPKLALREAEDIAIKNHPRITAAELKAMAAKQVVREVRASFFPRILADVTSVGAKDDNTRITAGGLNNPAIFDRNAEGLTVSQLITDFGRTANLTSSSKATAQAEAAGALATRDQILLAVNSAYFSALQAQAVLAVARQTVDSRQLVFDYVRISVTNGIKSALDESFAHVNLDDARLLLAKAENDLNAAFANLSTVLGYRELHLFDLIDQPLPSNLTNSVSELTAEALQQRPELVQLRYQRDAAAQFAKAEKKLIWPTISAVGSAGVTPVRDDRLADNYAAAGVNLALPLFTGGLYAARRSEAAYRAEVAEQNLRDQENTVIRDVRVTRLNVDYYYQRVGLTEQLLATAKEALTLAEANYKFGSTSIVELSQAQLSETAAEIGAASAKFDYQIQRAMLDFQIGRLR